MAVMERSHTGANQQMELEERCRLKTCRTETTYRNNPFVSHKRLAAYTRLGFCFEGDTE